MILYISSSPDEVDSIHADCDLFTNYDMGSLGDSIKTLFCAKQYILKVSGLKVTSNLLTKSPERNKLVKIISNRCMPDKIRIAALHVIESDIAK